MKKVAITGATGFIGHHVLKEIANHDVEVIALALPGSENLPVINNGRWKFIDISNPPSDIFDLIGRPDILIHLAWKGLPNYKSLHHFESELPVQYTFLKTLIVQGLDTLVVTGTCFEYGLQSGALSEDLETRPVTPYGFAKDTLRKQLEFLRNYHSFNLTWTRLFYIFGEGQAETSLYSQLKKAVSKKMKVFNMSGGEQLRDYLHVTDVASKLVTLALSQKNVGVINICSGKPRSVRKLVEEWIEENQWSIRLNLDFYPYPDYEPMAFWGNAKKV